MAASPALFRPTTTTTLTVTRPRFASFSSLSSIKVPANPPKYTFQAFKSESAGRRASPLFAATDPSSVSSSTTFHGLCYVVGDNIDTDQIIPAEYLTLVPSKPEEYKKLGSYAMCGLPSSYEPRFVDPDEYTSKFTIIIGGENFGCGSSREHAPVALGAAGTAAVVAESYARIFFRNSVATGEIYPFESEGRLCDECKTGDVVTIELGQNKLINHTSGKEYALKPIGDAGPVIEAGGIFAYAREAGMIPSRVA